MPKVDKYGNDSKYESWGDNYIFNPIADILIDPMRCIGFTPNMVTLLSTLLTLTGSYFMFKDKKYFTIILYLLGYLMDGIDGRMARKYNMGSKAGMVFDLVSDNITNLVLLGVVFYKLGLSKIFIFVIIAGYLLGISFGLNEAIKNFNKHGHDHFHKTYKEMLKDDTNIFYKIYLLLMNLSYKSYRSFFPEYNYKRINKWLGILKHFGPGNFVLFIAYLINNYLI